MHSFADSLIPRAADVTLKERHRLVLMPRETSLHVGHCELMLKAAQLGANIAPPVPAFYNKPQSLEDVVDHSVGRVLDLLDIDCGMVKRWKDSPGKIGLVDTGKRTRSTGWIRVPSI